MIPKKYFQEYLSAIKSESFLLNLRNEIDFKWWLAFLCLTMPCYLCIWFLSPIYYPCSYIVSNTNVPQGPYPSQLWQTSPINLPDCISQERGKDAEAFSALLPFNLGSLWGEERDIGCFVYSGHLSFSTENETGQQANCYKL